MSQSYLNVACYSNACENIFEMNIDSLKNEIDNFNMLSNTNKNQSFSEGNKKISDKDLTDIDKMLETILLMEALTKQNNPSCNNYQIASSFICKFS